MSTCSGLNTELLYFWTGKLLECEIDSNIQRPRKDWMLFSILHFLKKIYVIWFENNIVWKFIL